MICRFAAFLQTRMSQMNEPSQETTKLTTDTNQYPLVPGGSVGMILFINHQNGEEL